MGGFTVKRLWSDDEKSLIRDQWGKLSPKHLAEMLKCSIPTLRKAAAKMGLNPKPMPTENGHRADIDPTICEREYTDDEIEFMMAVDQYKLDSGRKFPTCSEYLEVFLKLGYRKG